MSMSIEGIASFSGRRPWWTLLGWLVVLVIAGFLSFTWGEEALDGEDGTTQILENQKASDLINERFGSLEPDEPTPGAGENARSTESEFLIITSTTSVPGDAAFEQRIDEFSAAVTAAEQEVASERENETFKILDGDIRDYEFEVSEDGTTALATIKIFSDEEERIDVLTDIAEEFTADGFEFLMLGNASVDATFTRLADEVLSTGEAIGIGVAIIILAIVLGAVIASIIPIILALVAVFTAIGMTAIIGQFMELNEFVPAIITMMGLAVGIDYSLFVLSRYREERGKGLEKQAAIEASGASAGRAVVFSGFTVVLALLGMLIMPDRIFQAFGVGAIIVVFVAVFTSMTLLPAIIGILGDRVNNVRAPFVLTLALFVIGVVIVSLTAGFGPEILFVSILVLVILSVLSFVRTKYGRWSFGLGQIKPYDPDNPSGIWNTITVAVMKRPYVSMTAATAFLLVLAFFFLQLEKGTSGISVLPDEEPSKQAFLRLNEQFGFGSDAPAFIAIDGDVDSPAIAQAITNLERLMASEPGFNEPEVRIEPSVKLAEISATVPGDPFNQDALETIRRLRSDLIPQAFAGVSPGSYQALVGGDSAEIVDAVKQTDQYLPIVFFAVLGLSFILLLIAFRSITVSIASIIMNLLSVGAAYGLVVLVFQKGFLIGLFGFEQVDQIEFWLPLFMFSILFGLSMDYHVFMLSRIKERFDETGDAEEAVAFGLRTTASIITGAALIMVAVFGGFALGDIAFFQSMGFGLGAAVLLDATIVRSLLVPSIMRILGKHAWYFPSWMEWLPNISIEGKSPVPEPTLAENVAPSGAVE